MVPQVTLLDQIVEMQRTWPTNKPGNLLGQKEF